MARDIDYAAIAVKKAISEKFGRKQILERLTVTANERTISVQDGDRQGEGSRDAILIAVRKSEDYDQFWQLLGSASGL